MEPTPAADFFETLLRCGVTLHEVLADVIEQIDDNNSFPGEEPGKVAIEMAAGSVELRLRREPGDELYRAADLMEAAVEAVLADLRAAAEIEGRRGRGYRLEEA
jgi:hypothetical protein